MFWYLLQYLKLGIHRLVSHLTSWQETLPMTQISYLLIWDPVLGFTDTKSSRIQAPCEVIFTLTQGSGFHYLLKQRKGTQFTKLLNMPLKDAKYLTMSMRLHQLRKPQQCFSKDNLF